MWIMTKHMLKNIFAKPFRTLLLVFCIASFVFTAMLCMDMSGSLQYLVKSMLTMSTGSSDIIVADPMGMDEEIFSISQPIDYVLVANKTSGFTEVPEGLYNYFHTDTFDVMTMDYSVAKQMKLIKEKLSLGEGEAAVSSLFAENFGIKKGDKLTLYSDAKEEVLYDVAVVLSDYGVTAQKAVVLLSEEGFGRLDYDGVIDYTNGYVDVRQDEQINTVAKELQDKDYRAVVTKILDGEEMKAMSRIFTLVFLLMFAICFLLVIFVTVSVSKRIVSERMPVVGTFRSLGLSSRFTTGFLVVESVVYGLLGSAIGCILYGIIRKVIFSALADSAMGSLSMEDAFGNVSIFTYVAVVVGAVLVECACSIREVAAAAKTSIRDIIFDNKDTKYKGNKKAYVAGTIFLMSAIVLLMFVEGIVPMVISFAAFIVSLSLLFPLVLKYCSAWLAGIFDRMEKPVLKLAAMEIYARKSTVGSTVLCVTTAALVIVLFIFANSLTAVYDIHTYDCDLHVTINNDQTAAMFEYIDGLPGVSDTEYLYIVNKSVTVGDAKEDVNIAGMQKGGFSLYTGIKNLPDKVENDECYMDKGLADKAGAKPGDMVSITFDAESFLPTTKEMRLAGYIDSYDVDTIAKTIVISNDLYVDIFHDYPGEVLVRCENVKATQAQIEKYSGSLVSSVESNEDYVAGWMKKKANLRLMIVAVMVLGIVLTVTGMVSNQLIGFDGRKRECAVLLSTAMNRGQLSKMFVVESMLSSGIALVCALPVGLVCFIPFKNIMAATGGTMKVSYGIGWYVLFLAVLWVVFSVVSLFPVSKLRKMKIAAQLKYE